MNPLHVPLAADELRGTPVRVCTVVGFPLGANCAATKAAEAQRAVAQGAAEVDMVVALGAVKACDWAGVYADVAGVVAAVAADGAVVKVILETRLLTETEAAAACLLAAEAGAGFVKTCTGFAGAAEVRDIQLMRNALAGYPTVRIKASGGVRSPANAADMLAAGAARIGTSSGIAIVGRTVVGE